MLDVVGLGENSIDYVYELASLPAGGPAKLPILSHAVRPGGQVATTMAACAALGLRAGYIGAFGSDAGASAARAGLIRRGVDLRHALTRDAPNRYAVILVDRMGERVVLWDRDARLTISPADVRERWISGARAVHVDGLDEEASIALARLGRAAGLPVTCDIDTVTTRTSDLFEAATVPILAEHVPMALSGESTIARALRSLRRHHPGRLVVTLGGRGAMMLEENELHHVPALAVNAVDTTGAGDVFRAGFIYGMLRGLRGTELLRIANAAAGMSCTRPGAIDSVPTLEEIQRLTRAGP